MRLEVYKAYLQEAKWTVDDVDIDWFKLEAKDGLFANSIYLCNVVVDY